MMELLMSLDLWNNDMLGEEGITPQNLKYQGYIRW